MEDNKKEKIREQIKKEYVHVSDNKRDCNIKWFIYAYTDDDDIRSEMLKEFPGAVISISHDRKYIDEVCDKVYCLTETGLQCKED